MVYAVCLLDAFVLLEHQVEDLFIHDICILILNLFWQYLLDSLMTFIYLWVFFLIHATLSPIQQKGNSYHLFWIVELCMDLQLLDKFFLLFLFDKFSTLLLIFLTLYGHEDWRDRVKWIWEYEGEKYDFDEQDEVCIVVPWLILGMLSSFTSLEVG